MFHRIFLLLSLTWGLLLGTYILTPSAYGGVEVSAHFGLKFSSNLNFQKLANSPSNNIWQDQKGRPWVLGGDALFKLPFGLSNLGIGLRYQYLWLPEQDYISNVLSRGADSSTTTTAENNTFKLNTHRIALLTNYRFFDTKLFFVGALLAIDLWRSLNIKTMLNEEGPNEIEIKHKQWIRASGQIAVEAGLKMFTGLFIRGEVGYDISSFSGDFECTNSASCENATQTQDNKIHLNSFYAIAGVGWFFG